MQTSTATEGSAISTFTKGAIIFRTKPATRTQSKKFSFYADELIEDNRFRTPMELVDIKNNLIYLKAHKPFSLIEEKTVYAAKVELFWNDWALVEPKKEQPTLFPDHMLKTPQPGTQLLLRSKGKSIDSFMPGDLIIRVKPPAKPKETIHSLHLPETFLGQDAYRKPMELIGIEDNIIHLKYKSSSMYERESRADLNLYENHWELFEMPEGVDDILHLAF